MFLSHVFWVASRFHQKEILAGALHEYTDWENPIQNPISVRDQTLNALADSQVSDNQEIKKVYAGDHFLCRTYQSGIRYRREDIRRNIDQSYPLFIHLVKAFIYSSVCMVLAMLVVHCSFQINSNSLTILRTCLKTNALTISDKCRERVSRILCLLCFFLSYCVFPPISNPKESELPTHYRGL